MRISQLSSAALLSAAVGALSIATIVAAGPASAQSKQNTTAGQTSGTTRNSSITYEQAPGMPAVDANQTVRGTNNREVFQVLGMSGVIAAPVTPAYNGDATYSTFAGDPGNGRNAVLAQSIDGAP